MAKLPTLSIPSPRPIFFPFNRSPFFPYYSVLLIPPSISLTTCLPVTYLHQLRRRLCLWTFYHFSFTIKCAIWRSEDGCTNIQPVHKYKLPHAANSGEYLVFCESLYLCVYVLALWAAAKWASIPLVIALWSLLTQVTVNTFASYWVISVMNSSSLTMRLCPEMTQSSH